MLERLQSLLTPRLSIALLVVITLGCYVAYLSHPFVTLDDNYLIYDNPAIQAITPATLLHVFTHFDPQLYIPLTFVSWQFTHLLFGLNPFFYHLINLLLHAGSAALLFVITEKLTKDRMIALLTALLFALHPLQTEAVLWATARKDTLSGFLFFASLASYLRFRDHQGKMWYWISVIGFALALLAKVSVVLLPGLFVLLDWYEGRQMLEKNQLRQIIPFGLLGGLFILIAFIGKIGVLGSTGIAMDVFLLAKSTLFYLWKILLPINFSVIYPQNEVFSFLSPTLLLTVGGFLMFLCVTLILLWTRRWPLIGFGLAWYVLMLLPSYSTFLKNGFLYFASDRYAYLASAGIFLVMAVLLVQLWRVMKGSAQSAIVSLSLLCVIVGFPLLVARQARAWSSSEAMYRNVIRVYPYSALAHNNLGMTVDMEGKTEEARREYEESIAIDPHQSIPYFNIAAHQGKAEQLDEQLQTYRHIIDIVRAPEIARPSELQRFFWLEEKFDRLGRPEDAERLLLRLLDLAPTFAQLHAHLGLRYVKEQKKEDAFRALAEADRLGSDDPNVYYHLAEMYSEQGMTAEVVRVLEKAVRLDPENAAARAELGRMRGMRD